MNRFAVSVLLVLALSLTACPGGGGGGGGGNDGGGNDGGTVTDGGGGSDGGVTDGGGGPLTAAEACQQYVADLKSRIVDCYAASQASVDAVVGSTDLCASILGAIGAGNVVFNPTAAATCFNRLTTDTCPQLAMLFAATTTPCTDMFSGTVVDGQPCYASMDCKYRSYCNSTTATCPGTCTADVQGGGDCRGGAVCASGTCNGQTCQAPVRQGDACGGTTGVSCPPYSLYCQGATPTASGTCQPVVADGAVCDAPDACQLGDHCYNGTCSATHGVGGSCSADTDCGLLEYCASGTCTDYPTTGGTCGLVGGSYVGCLGSYCMITNQQTYSGTCTAYVASGTACNPSDLSCGPGSSCVNGTCQTDCTEP